MQALPDGWPRISSALVYDDPRAAIDWLCKAFGLEVRLVVETGSGAIAHSELVFGDGVIMVSGTNAQYHLVSPKSAGGSTQTLLVYVDDVAAHCEHARKHGAEISAEPANKDYGDEYWTDRSYGAVDCGGHNWWFVQRVRTGDPSWSRTRNKVDKSHRG